MSRRPLPDPHATARGLRRGRAAAVALVRGRVRGILAFKPYGIPVDERADLEQEVLTQIWQAVRRPGFEPERFWGLVEVVTVRRSIDWLRTRRPTVPVDETVHAEALAPAAPAAGPLRRSLDRERDRRLALALAAAPEPCRELIRRRIGLDQSYPEISRRVGRSPGALRVQMYRCIQRLRDALAAADDAAATKERSR